MSNKILFFAKQKSIKARIVIKYMIEMSSFESSVFFLVTNCENIAGDILNLFDPSNVYILTADQNLLELWVSGVEPDFIISCGWDQKINPEIISLSKIGSVNCHSSFLPDYKGASVFKHQWANLEESIGATIHVLDKKFDTGKIISQIKLDRFWYDTPYSILIRISIASAPLLELALILLSKGYKGRSQVGGRYFFKCSNKKFVLIFLANQIRKLFGLQPVVTKYKEIN